eukprot:334998-Chlamydomonas_euryale.AAC.2
MCQLHAMRAPRLVTRVTAWGRARRGAPCCVGRRRRTCGRARRGRAPRAAGLRRPFVRRATAQWRGFVGVVAWVQLRALADVWRHAWRIRWLPPCRSCRVAKAAAWHASSCSCMRRRADKRRRRGVVKQHVLAPAQPIWQRQLRARRRRLAHAPALLLPPAPQRKRFTFCKQAAARLRRKEGRQVRVLAQYVRLCCQYLPVGTFTPLCPC